jgi:flavin reductase (DIM6/NTAB) family NADH-FMN oxidoreductase RutF
MFNTLFTPISPESVHDNIIKLINKDWMLITSGTPAKFNTMTASWGTAGILWNKPIAICFIRPHRYTFEFVEKYADFTLSFFSEQYRSVLNYCGAHSGRSVDKMAKTGLTPIETAQGNITFAQSRLVLECRKLYADHIKEQYFIDKDLITRNYPQKDFHKFFIGEIIGCYTRTPGK